MIYTQPLTEKQNGMPNKNRECGSSKIENKYLNIRLLKSVATETFAKVHKN